MASPTKPSGLRPRLSLLAALLLALLSSSRAIDLGRAFKKKDDASASDLPKDKESKMTAEDALASAKKLVNDMNDASTGTVTSYQPGREKEPVTCNEIMAKSLVVANEEKAAVVAEKDAVVKAAALLSEKIDDLTAKLEGAKEEILLLEKAQELLEEEKAGAEEASKKREEEALAAMEAKMAEERGEFEEKLKAAEDSAEKAREDAEERVRSEVEKSKLNMDALKNATAASIAKIEKETAESIASNERRVAEKIEEAENRVMSVQEDARNRVDMAQQGADDKIKSIMNRAERDRIELLDRTQMQVSEAKAEAEQQVSLAQMNMADNDEMHRQEKREMREKHADEIKELKEENERKVKEVQEQMTAAIAKANRQMNEEKEDSQRRVKEAQDQRDEAIAAINAQLNEEREAKKKVEAEMSKKAREAVDKERGLMGELRLQRSASVKLEGEVSFWKEAHESQGYCNTTLIREDGRRILNDALDGAGRGFESVQRTLSAGLGSQMEMAQQTGADVIEYFEKELLPGVERVIGEGYDKAVALYDEHLAATVNEHVLPFYNQNIHPVYVEHVSPVVKTIEGEAAIAMEKSREGLSVARSKSARAVQKSADDFMEVLEEKKIDTKLPGWLYSFIDRCSADGEWAVDTISRGLLVVLVIMCRGLIYRVIGMVFSLIWFFCPLRLFVGGRSKTAENGAKVAGGSNSNKKKDVPQSTKAKPKNGKNGNATVY